MQHERSLGLSRRELRLENIDGAEAMTMKDANIEINLRTFVDVSFVYYPASFL